MAGHPQNSPRGLFAKQGPVTLGDNTLTSAASGVQFSAGVALSGQSGYITQTASGVKMPTGLALSGSTNYLTANSTAPVILPTRAAIPTTKHAGGLCVVSNSTGWCLAMNTTGTTWRYLDTTSVQRAYS